MIRRRQGSGTVLAAATDAGGTLTFTLNSATDLHVGQAISVTGAFFFNGTYIITAIVGSSVTVAGVYQANIIAPGGPVIPSPAQPDRGDLPVRPGPGYRGPDDAFNTPFDIMASPASVGTTILNATGPTYFGVRDLIKSNT